MTPAYLFYRLYLVAPENYTLSLETSLRQGFLVFELSMVFCVYNSWRNKRNISGKVKKKNSMIDTMTLSESTMYACWLTFLYLLDHNYTSDRLRVFSFFMIMTMSTRWVRSIGSGCLHLLGTRFHLYLFRGPCFLCFEFVLRYINVWDGLPFVFAIFHF